MTLPAERLRMTYAEYLALQGPGVPKHEFLDGEVWAMTGGTLRHSLLAGNAFAQLRATLPARCQVWGPDARVRVEATGLATYPDLSVVCGELRRHPEDEDAIANPLLLLEVLSRSTESYDRGEKFAHYRRVPSLRHYLLVSQDRRRVDHFHLRDGEWIFEEVSGASDLRLAELNTTLPLDALYARW